jgi:hypothetical protein
MATRTQIPNIPRTSASIDILQTKLLFFRNFVDNSAPIAQDVLYADGSGGTFFSSLTIENIRGFSSFYASTLGIPASLGSFGYLSTGQYGYVGIGVRPASNTLDVSGSVFFHSSCYVQGPMAIGKVPGQPILGTLDVSGSIIGSNLYILGNATVNGTVTASAYLTSSDSNLKKDIETYVPSGNAWETLRGVRFNWKSNDRPDIGFLAQELATVVPEAVNTNSQGEIHIEPTKILPLLVETIKDLREQVKEMDIRLAVLEQYKH